jgi:hypothetical protein
MTNPKTRSPRIQVTLPPEVMDMLRELSELTGQSMGGMVSELMREALPTLRVTAEAIRRVKEAPREAQAMLARHANEASIKLAQTQLEFDDLVSKKPAPKHQKRKRGPRGAT